MFNALFRRRKKTSSASIAKERLQIIVAHERNQNAPSKQQPDFLNALQKDILEVVRKYMPIDSNQIKVAVDKEDGCDVLELNIVLLEPEENTEGSVNQETDTTQQESSSKPAPVVENNETR